MAAWMKHFRSYFHGFGNVLTGIIIGAGLTKIFYETSDTVKEESTTVNKEIEDLIASNENLKRGRHLRTVNPVQRQEEQSLDTLDGSSEVSDDQVLKHGLPQRSPDYMRYKNHVLCYDRAKKTPRWVMEHLTKDKLKGDANRAKSTFKPDLNIPVIFQSSNVDYWDSGWSRGHMAPASNNKHDQNAMDATFYLSNIVPQDLDNNAGFWYRIEAYCRGLTKRYSDVYVISGPLYLPREEDGKKIVRYEVIGTNNVAVPTHLYKVVLAEDDKKATVVGAFVVPNKPIGYEHKLQDFQVALDDLEKDSGLVYFPAFDISRACDLCETDGCKLLSKERMDLIVFGRKLRSASCMEDLQKVWEEMKEKSITPDNFTREIYEKRKTELLENGAALLEGGEDMKGEGNIKDGTN